VSKHYPHHAVTEIMLRHMLCELLQTVPKTCCVLKNGNLSDQQPKNKSICYEQAMMQNSTSEEYVHHKAWTLLMLSVISVLSRDF